MGRGNARASRPLTTATLLREVQISRTLAGRYFSAARLRVNQEVAVASSGRNTQGYTSPAVAGWFERAVATVVVGLSLQAAPAIAASAGATAPAMVEVGRSLPNVLMNGLNGPHRPLSSYRGRPLVINVWASWCSPCRKEAASLERLAWSEAGGAFTVIGISTDDDRKAALDWLGQSNATLNHYIDLAPRWTLENLLGASSVPLTVLVDANGRVVARFRGARDWSTAESIQLIERAFAGR